MIAEKLNNQILDVIRGTHREPRVIVMHPVTWTKLCKEICRVYNVPLPNEDEGLKYNGYRVLRSIDVVEGEFVM